MPEVLLARLDDITGAVAGLVATASNTGTVGVGVFKAKVGTDLQFYKINPASTRVSFSIVGSDRIDIDVNQANLAIGPTQITPVTSDRLLGRDTAGAGAAEEITVGGGLGFTGGLAIQINDNGVTDAKLRDSAAVSVIGRSVNSGGDPADIAAAANDTILGRRGNVLTWAAIATAEVSDGAITYAKMVDFGGASRLLGRGSAGGAGDPQEITLGASFVMNGTVLERAALTGDVTAAQNGNATTIANDAVTYAKMQNISAASRLLGRGSAGGSGDPEEIALGTGLTMSGTTLNAAPSGLVPIERKTGASVASYDFTTGISSTYRTYLLAGFLFPATDDVELWLRTDANGGASFDAGASDYKYAGRHAGSAADNNSTAAAQILVAGHGTAAFAIGNGAGEGIAFQIWFHNPSASNDKTKFVAHSSYWAANDTFFHVVMGGCRDTTQITNAVRLLFESGNISSGDVTLYGVANS